MNSFQAPFVNSQTTPDKTAVEPSAHVSHGGGGSIPPDSGGPARANGESTQTSAQTANSFFTEESPLVVRASSGFAARTPHDTPVDPAAYHRWRQLFTAGLLSEAADFCREQHEAARTEPEQVCWTKDLCIVKRAQGDYWGAYDLHRAILPAVSRLTGSFRARCEQGFARSLETLHWYDKALLRYDEARWHAEQARDLIVCARVDVNVGRCLTAANRPEDSHSLFDCAQTIAEHFADTLLCGEIDESRALAFEAQGLFREARKMAARSIYLLEGTPYIAALLESRATYERLLGESEQRWKA